MRMKPLSRMNPPAPETTPSRLTLTEAERHSALWSKLRQHYQDRLEALRLRNEKTLPEAETAKLRGHIAEIRTLLTLDEDTTSIREQLAANFRGSPREVDGQVLRYDGLGLP